MKTNTEQWKEAFQLENISLAQSNGHPFENSDTKNGLQFWELPARKYYTIPNIPAPESSNTDLLEQNIQVFQQFFP